MKRLTIALALCALGMAAGVKAAQMDTAGGRTAMAEAPGVEAAEVKDVKDGNTISGHVVEKSTEASLPHATILIVETGQGAVTDASGDFVFRGVPAGRYTLRCRLLGYTMQEKTVTVSPDYTAKLHFVMEEEGFVTNEVVVSANRNEVSRKEAPVIVNVMGANCSRP